MVASPRMVEAKLLLRMSTAPPALAPELPPAPSKDVPERCDSPFPVATARISPVFVSTMRALTDHHGLGLFSLNAPDAQTFA